MNDLDLKQYFTENISEIETIAEIHKHKYERDVVVSNLFLYLYQRENEVNKLNIKSYIIRWCSMLKYWNMNRSEFLMEEKKNQNRFVNISDLPIENEASDVIGLTIDFEREFRAYLDSLDSYLDRCILRDYYEVKTINTTQDIMDFYKVKKRQAYEIKKRIKTLEFGLLEFINKNQKS